MKTNEMRGSIRSTPLPEISPFETDLVRNNKVFTVTKSAMACSTLSACPAWSTDNSSQVSESLEKLKAYILPEIHNIYGSLIWNAMIILKLLILICNNKGLLKEDINEFSQQTVEFFSWNVNSNTKAIVE